MSTTTKPDPQHADHQHAAPEQDVPQNTAPRYVAVPEIADALGIVVTRVHQLVRDRQVIAVRVDGALRIPAQFIQDGLVVKGLPGTITVLSDAGYGDQEIIDWLFRTDDSLPGSPIEALRANRSKEVHRRAQAAGF